jgi:RNA polymerase sigma-70 factor (ECF subfamily)
MAAPKESLRDFDRARNGNSSAVNGLLSIWRERFAAVSHHQLKQIRSRVDTSDVVQESLVQAWQGIDQFSARSEGEFRSWARKVAKGRLANARRFHTAERRNVQTEVGSKPLAGCARSTSDSRWNLEDVDAVRQAMESLEPQLRLVVQKRYFEQSTFSEIASAVGCSPAGARLLCQKALLELRRCMLGKRTSLDSSPDF